MKNRVKKIFFSLVLSAIFVLSGGLIDVLIGLEALANENNYVTISIERFTLASGYYLEPVQISVTGPISVREALKAFSVGTVWQENSLVGIEGAQVAGFSTLRDSLSFDGDLPANRENPGEFAVQSAMVLSNGDYHPASQWMMTVNNHLLSACDQALLPGDVLRLQFSLAGKGTDLGPAQAGQTELVRLIAKLKADPDFIYYLDNEAFASAYYQALAMEYRSGQDTFDQAVNRLAGALPVRVKEIKFHEDRLELRLNEEAILGITILADQIVEKSALLWESSDPSTVSVNCNGQVIGHRPGTAIISARSLSGGLSDSCRVQVRAIPITGIKLSSEELLMEVGQSYDFGINYYPEDTTDLKTVAWISSAAEIGEISATGVLVAKKIGKLQITARSQSGIEATCQVRIESTRSLAEEIERRIGDFPAPDQLKFSDRDNLLKIKDDYDNLSLKAQNLIDPALKDKLAALMAQLMTLQENQRIASEIIQAIESLPAKEDLSLGDETNIQALIRRYENEISSEQRDLIDQDHLDRLFAAEKRILTIKKENQMLADQVMGFISDLPLKSQLDLLDYELMVKARKSFNQLGDDQKVLVLNYESLNQAEEKLTKLIAGAIESVNDQQLSLASEDLQNFILASKIYQLITVDQQRRIGEEFKNRLFEIQTLIKEDNQRAELSLDLPFNIRTNIKMIEAEDKIFREIQEQMGDSLVRLYELSFEDLYQYGRPYKLPPGELVEISIKVADENIDGLFGVAISDRGQIKAYENKAEEMIVFEAGDFSYLGLASSSVNLQAINLPIEAGLNEAVEKSFTETASYLLTVAAKPTIQTGSWESITFARGSHPVPPGYYESYYNNVVAELNQGGGKLSGGAVTTDYAKTILALTAMGKDPANVGGYNLLDQLADLDQVKRGGMMSYVWTLMALDADDYQIPLTISGTQTSRELLLQAILEREVVDGQGVRGGFSLFNRVNGQAESDVTAIVLQALAKYQDQEEVKPVISRGLNVLSKLQQDNGGYGAFNAPQTCESTAQVILALTALGIDPAKDQRFIKGENWLLGELMTYALAGGGFTHLKGDAGGSGGGSAGKIDGMASNQASQAIIAYRRFLEGKNWIFKMSDGTELIFDANKSLEDLEADYQNNYESQGGGGLDPNQSTGGGSGLSGGLTASAGGTGVSGGKSAGGGKVSAQDGETPWVFDPEIATTADKKDAESLRSELVAMSQQKTIGLIGGGLAILIFLIALVVIKKKKLVG